MKHRASTKFWQYYHGLPAEIQKLADSNFAVLKRDPHHPSLHFKKVGRLWSARVGIHYRAVAVQKGDQIASGSGSDATTNMSSLSELGSNRNRSPNNRVEPTAAMRFGFEGDGLQTAVIAVASVLPAAVAHPCRSA